MRYFAQVPRQQDWQDYDRSKDCKLSAPFSNIIAGYIPSLRPPHGYSNNDTADVKEFPLYDCGTKATKSTSTMFSAATVDRP